MAAYCVDFGRLIPLFPLPNCVLFPGVVQPLHIFEPRYQVMMEETLEAESLLAIALLREGWEEHYHATPAIHETVCVGKVIAHERVEDGKYNLLLHGVTRARVVEEQKVGPYRAAMMEPLNDVEEGASIGLDVMQRKVIGELFEKTALRELTIAQTMGELMASEVPTSRLIDVLSYTLVQDVAVKQRLLEELDPVKRGEMLLREMVMLAQSLGSAHAGAVVRKTRGKWPPDLNAN